MNMVKNEPKSLWERIFSLFVTVGDAERDKRRLLKEIKKDLKKRGKYYKINSNTAQPALAKLFFEMYKVVGPAQILLESLKDSNVIRSIIIENFLTPEQRTLVESLSESNIRKRCSAAKSLKDVRDQIKEEVIQTYTFFDMPAARSINRLYSSLMVMQEFIKFDYYFLLKKFDSLLPERDFKYNPRFESINGEYILDDLKDFDIVLPMMSESEEWDIILNVLSQYRDMEVISRDGWKKVLQIVKDMKKSRILELIIKVLDENPGYKAVTEGFAYEIVEDYLSDIKKTAEKTLMSIFEERKKNQRDSLLTSIFGTTSVVRMKYYTEKANMAFSKKVNPGFMYVEPLNFLKAFFLDYYKGPIRQMVDRLLITGKWTSNIASQQFSESYHQLMSLTEDLLRFDNSLAEETELGAKLKRMMRAADRDRNALDAMRNVLKTVNNDALSILNDSIQHLLTIGKNMKRCIDDYKAAKHELIVNWKEIEVMSDEPLINQMSDLYKKIYYFLQLMQYYLKEE
jgi:hypothetical protein